MIRIVAVSDTHGFHRSVVVPDGDVFVHAGDITMNGELDVIADFAAWVAELPHRHKVIVPGNHDRSLDISQTKFDGGALRLLDDAGANVHYLVDASRTLVVSKSGVTEKIKVYGAPWVPHLSGWAFWDRNRDMFETAPRDIDVLVTHGPPFGIRDDSISDTHFGSRALVRYLNRCPLLKAHIFGHVHEQHGQSKIGEIVFANASTCSRLYEPVNPALIIDI